MTTESAPTKPSKLVKAFRRRILAALDKIPVSEYGEEIMIWTPYETPNFETINVHIRRHGKALELADGGTLASHYDASRASLEKPPLGFDRLIKYYECRLRDGELVRTTDEERLVEDALEFIIAIAAIAALTSNLASKSSNPFPSDVRAQLRDRGYGVGRGRIEVADFIVRYDIAYEPKNIAMQCVGGPETRVSSPEREVRNAIDRLLEVAKFTNKETILVLDPDHDWWRPFEVPLRQVSNLQLMNGTELYDFLGSPE